MNKEIKEKWVAALRSGSYKQATGGLFSDKGYCCLGVLCDLYAKEHQAAWEKQPLDDFYSLSGSNSKYTLPNKIQKWAELPTDDPSVICKDGDTEDAACLSELNDGSKLSFNEIADLIELHL